MSLPSELLVTILAYLPLQTLLAFSVTCRTNRVHAQTVLQELNLAVFPRNLHGRLALLEHNEDTETFDFSVIKTTTLERTSKTSNLVETLRRQVSAQNKIATDVLSNKLTHNLRSLSLHMYELNSSELASMIATNLSKLRDLALKFHHPFIHDDSISLSHWKDAPAGSPCWNPLVGLGAEHQKNLRLRNLHCLHIERAGLTSAQLRKFVESNPSLRRLILDNVTGVDQDFARWLGAYCGSGRSRLEEITLEGCPQLKMQKLDDFAWLAGITKSSVKYLSLFRCRNVRHEMLVNLIEGEDEELELNTLETINPPKGTLRHFGVLEEIGPGYLPVIMTAGVAEVEKRNLMMDKIDVDPEFITHAIRAGT